MQTILFIINPHSGVSSKADLPSLIEAHLDHEKYSYEIAYTQHAGHATELAADARDRGVDIVCAVGGDGTVNEVGRALVHSNTALAIVPLGSGNGLARHLLLPLNIRKSLEVINAGEIQSLDYGTINEHPFFCTCGIGYDALISQRFATAPHRGPISYAERIIQTGFEYKPETYEIVDHHGISECRAFLISCANASQYGNNAYIAPSATMSDGLLDVTIIVPFDLIEAPQIFLEMMNKTIDQHSKVRTWKAKSLHIRRNSPGIIHYDGDPVNAGTDIHIQIHEQGIRIVVNPNGDKTTRRPNAMQNAASQLFNQINEFRHGVREFLLGNLRED